MAKKIFFGNYKGGVGKTTSAFYLAKYFAELIGIQEQLNVGSISPEQGKYEELAKEIYTDLYCSQV